MILHWSFYISIESLLSVTICVPCIWTYISRAELRFVIDFICSELLCFTIHLILSKSLQSLLLYLLKSEKEQSVYLRELRLYLLSEEKQKVSCENCSNQSIVHSTEWIQLLENVFITLISLLSVYQNPLFQIYCLFIHQCWLLNLGSYQHISSFFRKSVRIYDTTTIKKRSKSESCLLSELCWSLSATSVQHHFTLQSDDYLS